MYTEDAEYSEKQVDVETADFFPSCFREAAAASKNDEEMFEKMTPSVCSELSTQLMDRFRKGEGALWYEHADLFEGYHLTTFCCRCATLTSREDFTIVRQEANDDVPGIVAYYVFIAFKGWEYNCCMAVDYHDE